MKAWIVTQPDEESAVVVFEETRGKARATGMSDLGSGDEYLEYSVKRSPYFDRFAEQGFVPLLDKLNCGWWCTCNGAKCCKRIDQEDIDSGRAVIIGDDAYCVEHAPSVEVSK